MPYILPPNTFAELDFLKDRYQKKKNINLDEKPSMMVRPLFLGGVDIAMRTKQIEFLEKCLIVFKPQLCKEAEIKDDNIREAHITASRAMIAAILYVQHQIGGTYSIRSAENAELYRLLNDDLHISKKNYLDEEDKAVCFSTAKLLFGSSISAITDANKALKDADKKPFSPKEWNKFLDFLCEKTKGMANNHMTNYPITSITAPLFGAAFACTGAAVGMIAGDTIGKSTKFMATKYQLTAYVGGTILVFGSAGPGGVALFAPIIAERLINYFCTISMAFIFSTTFGFLGRGVGTAVGMILDATYKLLVALVTSMGNYSKITEKLPTGIRICDGVCIIGGAPIEMKDISQLPENCKVKHVDAKEDGLYVDGKLISLSKDNNVLPADALAELKEKLRKNGQEIDVEEEVEEEESPQP